MFLNPWCRNTSNFNALRRFLSSSISENGRFVKVQPANGHTMKFPSVWLRDNCQCTECFHDNTQSRKINWERFNSKIRAEAVSHDQNDNGCKTITIEWDDKHKSVYNLKWLEQRDFSAQQRKRYIDEIYKPRAKLWSKIEFPEVRQTFDFNDVINDDKVLLKWLLALAVEGFAIIKNSPHDVTVARQLANRIGFVKRTTYGEEFEVISKQNARNYAYMMTALPLHTDMPYCEYKAGINILHCYVQSKSNGGGNLMTDGFYVANKLREEYPEHYQVLLRTPVDWFDIGRDSGMSFHNIWRSPVICLDADGNYHRINFNNTKRDSHFTIPLESIEPWYEAFDKFLEIAYNEAVEFKTQPGEVFVFNNLRMLHGRSAYEDSAENKRHLVGAYVDWDLIYSKIRLLKGENQD